jgi:hypothetical protein
MRRPYTALATLAALLVALALVWPIPMRALLEGFAGAPTGLRLVPTVQAPPMTPSPQLNAGDGTPRAPPPIDVSAVMGGH